VTKIAERRASGVKEYLIRVRIEPSKFSSLTINDSRRADVPKDADGLAVDGPSTIRPLEKTCPSGSAMPPVLMTSFM